MFFWLTFLFFLLFSLSLSFWKEEEEEEEIRYQLTSCWLLFILLFSIYSRQTAGAAAMLIQLVFGYWRHSLSHVRLHSAGIPFHFEWAASLAQYVSACASSIFFSMQRKIPQNEIVVPSPAESIAHVEHGVFKPSSFHLKEIWATTWNPIRHNMVLDLISDDDGHRSPYLFLLCWLASWLPWLVDLYQSAGGLYGHPTFSWLPTDDRPTRPDQLSSWPIEDGHCRCRVSLSCPIVWTW